MTLTEHSHRARRPPRRRPGPSRRSPVTGRPAAQASSPCARRTSASGASYTWADDVGAIVESPRTACSRSGSQPGDRVSIHAEDRPEWVVLDLATVAMRGDHGRLLPDQPGGRGRVPAHRLRCLRAPRRGPGAVRQGGGDRPLPSRRPAHGSCSSSRGAWSATTTTRLLFWDTFLELGRTHRAEHPGAVAERMAAAAPDDVMTLVYTSGTTGPPKGAMLTNRNAEFCIDVIVNSKDRVPGRATDARRPDRHLPAAVPRRRARSSRRGPWSASGAVLNFAESIETVNENLREVQPTLFFAVPRIWEKLHAVVADQGQRRHLVQAQGPAVRPRARRAASAGPRSPTAATTPLASRVARTPSAGVLVFRAMRERLGLRRCRYAASGAAPIAPEVLEFFIGHRRAGLRAVRHDRELGGRHRELRRAHEARHRRRAVPRHRASASTRAPARSRPSTTACSPGTGASPTRRPRRSPTTAG